MTFLCNGTPEISVHDNRGQAVRQLRYNRRDVSQPVEEQIERHELALTGQPLSLTDARFFAANNGLANFRYVTSLSGRILQQVSLDAGENWVLFNAAGSSVWACDANGTQSRMEYDVLGRPGAAYQQQADESVERVADRFIYGETVNDAKNRNLRGQCVEHYDAGGRVEISAVALSGQTQQQTRWLLASAGQEADWQGEDQSAWQQQLDATAYVTLQTFNACGQRTSLTDAKGNQQTQSYNIAGQTGSSSLQKTGATANVIISDITYSAAGQVLQVSASGGVSRAFGYEETTQRLLTVVTQRPAASGGMETLEDILYGYDPLGNVTSMTDRRQATRWYAQQAVNGSQSWGYDALYQLISATGRENASAGVQSPSLPATTTDASQLVNYQRTYSYDNSFNLLRIAHSGAQQYSQNMVVSSASNRAVSETLATGIAPEQVDSYFDAGGHALWLQSGQPLAWSSVNRLAQVTLVDRGEEESDREIFDYDSQGNRLRKLTITLTGNARQTQQVVYLPGLELRVTSTDNGGSVTVNDALVINTLSGGPGVSGRYLYREQGTEDAITAEGQLRLSLGNLIDSVMLELDGNGTILSREEYFPFGGTAVLAGDSGELKYKYVRYSGKERDASGLYYYGQRYYMPWLGRWASSDPAGTVDGMNLYCFVNNSPVSHGDVAGLINEANLSSDLLSLIKESSNTRYGGHLNTLYKWGMAVPAMDVSVMGGRVDVIGTKPTEDRSINPFANEINVVAAEKHSELVASSRRAGLTNNLGEGERQIINLYSQESGPFHNMMLGWTLPDGYAPAQARALHDALDKMPSHSGNTYRGAMLGADTMYNENDGGYFPKRKTNLSSGSLVSTTTFFSTSAEVKVASEFVMRQRFGNAFSFDSVVFDIDQTSGKNITELTHLQQAEILLQPGAIFEVSDVYKDDFGLTIGLKERSSSLWEDDDVLARGVFDYRFGSRFTNRPTYPN